MTKNTVIILLFPSSLRFQSKSFYLQALFGFVGMRFGMMSQSRSSFCHRYFVYPIVCGRGPDFLRRD